MDGKPKPNPGDTVVLDDDEQKILDSLTLTSVIRDAAGLPQDSEEQDEETASVEDLDLGFLVPDD